VKFTMAELHGMLVQAMRSLKVGERRLGGGGGEAIVSAAQDEAPRRPAASSADPPGRLAVAGRHRDRQGDLRAAGRPGRLEARAAGHPAAGQIEERFDARLAETLYPAGWPAAPSCSSTAR
jgi:hypothetical protein